MTYVEGASLHQERGGSTVFARYAFNELVSFVAGWAILLDYMILIAVTCLLGDAVPARLLEPAGPPRGGARAGARVHRARRARATSAASAGAARGGSALLVVGDLALQAFIVVLGLVLFFNPHTLLDPIHLGSAPTWSDLIFALTVAAIAFTSLESAAGLAGEVRISRGALQAAGGERHRDGRGRSTSASRSSRSRRCPCTAATPNWRRAISNAPMIGIVDADAPALAGADARATSSAGWRRVTLVAAANSAMLGLSRLAYSLSTNRQIPSGLGRLHPQRSTPYVLIILAGRDRGRRWWCRRTSTSSSASTRSARCSRSRSRTCRSAGCATREPDRDRPYRVPLSVRVRGGELPLPAVVRRARLGRRLGRGDGRARAGPLRRARLDGRRDSRCT